MDNTEQYRTGIMNMLRAVSAENENNLIAWATLEYGAPVSQLSEAQVREMYDFCQDVLRVDVKLGTARCLARPNNALIGFKTLAQRGQWRL